MTLMQRWRIETLAGNTIFTTTSTNAGPVAAVENAGLTMRDVKSVVAELPVREES